VQVLIAGGGIGGLCLAQGLHRAGVDVTVFERAASPEAFREGYRIHIDPDGSRALHDCLPAERFALFDAACGRPPRSFTFLTEGLDELLSVDVVAPGTRPDPIAAHRSINRYTLRQILLDGLGDRVVFGRELRRYEVGDDDTVTARFADGSRASGSVLVGAEGTGSAVRAQLLPHADRVDTGVAGIAGRLPLTSRTRGLLPPELEHGPAMVLAPRGRNLFLATHEGVAGTEVPEHLLPTERGDYLLWALSAKRLEDPGDLAPAALRGLALRLASAWHPRLREIIAESETASISAYRIRTAVPVPPWPAGVVTVLGDAIHSMPPSRGIGANTALRDAALLRRNLIAAGPGSTGIVAAVAGYEDQMRDYGFAAVKASVQAMRQSVTSNPIAFTASKLALRIFNTFPAIRDRVFGAS